MGDFVESVEVVGLVEALIPHEIVVIAKGVGDLLEDDHDADAGQHALDDHVRDEISNDAGSQKTDAQLERTRKQHRESEGGERLQFLNGLQDDHRQTGGRAADTQFGTGKERNDDPPYDAGDDAADERRTRGQGHS